MSRSERWVSMSAVALAAALLTGDIGCQKAATPAGEQGTHAAGDACPADAKPADLSLNIKDMNGADVALSSFKGKLLLINFWATWCAPCKAEIPGFVELQKQYGKDLQILGVSVDDTPEDIKPYAQKYGINYPLLIGLNREDVEKAYGPFLGIPQSFLINREGKICVKHPGLVSKDKFEQEIKSLL